MRYGHTQEMIEAAGLHLEQNPGADVLIVGADMRCAEFMIRQITRRVKWKKRLREFKFLKSHYETQFQDGSKIRAISANSHSQRGRLVDRVFVENRVDEDKLAAYWPCERPYHQLPPWQLQKRTSQVD